MIEFVILEDNLSYLHKYKKIIDKVMMNYDIEYEMIVFDKYSKETQNFLEKEIFKIYLLSYEKAKKTQEMIEYIREKQNDWQSLMILIENKEEIRTDTNYFLLDTLSKQTDFMERLKRDIQISLSHYDQRPNTLKYCYKKVFYSIEYWKIIYIEKEQDTKKCIIKTMDNTYPIQGGLSTIGKRLDNRFLKCNRSYLINLEQIESYNPKTNVITFKNKEELDIVSRDKRKEVMNYFRGLRK